MPTSPERSGGEAAVTVRYRRGPIALWLFAGFWCGGVVMFTALLWRDGMPADSSPLWTTVAMLAFWLGVFGLGAYAFRQPIVTLRVWRDGRTELVRQWLLARRVLTVRAGELRMQLQSGRDSDGDPYFWLKLFSAELDGPLTIVEGQRVDCDAVAARLHAAGVVDAGLLRLERNGS